MMIFFARNYVVNERSILTEITFACISVLFKVWVLTGDKQETAIEIAMTCQLITRQMHTIILNSEYAKMHYDKGKTIATVAHHRAARRDVSFLSPPSVRSRSLELCARMIAWAVGFSSPPVTNAQTHSRTYTLSLASASPFRLRS